jgi:hypothetical protein
VAGPGSVGGGDAAADGATIGCGGAGMGDGEPSRELARGLVLVGHCAGPASGGVAATDGATIGGGSAGTGDASRDSPLPLLGHCAGPASGGDAATDGATIGGGTGEPSGERGVLGHALEVAR